MKRRKKRLLTAAGLVSAAVLISALDVRLTVRRYEVDAPLEAPVRLALVSDLHSCRYGEGQERLLDALTRQSPDAVLLAGDILDDEMPPAPALQFLSEAAQRWPCVYVSGNHEVWTGRLPEILSHIETLGVHVLQGERLTLTLRGMSIDLLGLDDPAVGTSLYSRELDGLAALPETGHFSVLLAHRPERYQDYAPLSCESHREWPRPRRTVAHPRPAQRGLRPQSGAFPGLCRGAVSQRRRTGADRQPGPCPGVHLGSPGLEPAGGGHRGPYPRRNGLLTARHPVTSLRRFQDTGVNSILL